VGVAISSSHACRCRHLAFANKDGFGVDHRLREALLQLPAVIPMRGHPFDDVSRETNQFVGLNFVTAQGSGQGEVEIFPKSHVEGETGVGLLMQRASELWKPSEHRLAYRLALTPR
jgi:hypothetical protein